LRCKPLKDLAPDEIGLAVRQRVGFPFILDLALDRLRQNPIFEGEFYPGDVLAALTKVPNSAWSARPHLLVELAHIRQEAISAIAADETGDLHILAGELNPQP
jgi:hypothetical protein